MSRKIGGKLVPAVAAIRDDMFDEGKQAAGLFDEVHGAVPALNASQDRLDAKQQPYRIGKRVVLEGGSPPLSGGFDGLGDDDGGRGQFSIGSCVTSITSPHGDAQLYER